MKQHLTIGQHLLVSAVGLTDQVTPELVAVELKLNGGQLTITTNQGTKTVALTAQDFG